MGALAELFAASGRTVRGSDAAAYPPMSTRLEAAGIEILDGYDAAHLDPPADLTVIGNAAVPTHPEAAAARERGLVQASFPEALGHVFLAGRRPVVVAGTHGKTTTTGLMTHVFREAGLDPGFLVGGVMAGDEATSGLGTGPHFVVEGDEYDAAYFDKRPKMLLYRPQAAVVTSLEFDHADIYDDWDDYRDGLRDVRRAASRMPSGGHLVLWGDDPDVRALAAHTPARVTFYGDGPRLHGLGARRRAEPRAASPSASSRPQGEADVSCRSAAPSTATTRSPSPRVALGEGIPLATVAARARHVPRHGPPAGAEGRARRRARRRRLRAPPDGRRRDDPGRPRALGEPVRSVAEVPAGASLPSSSRAPTRRAARPSRRATARPSTPPTARSSRPRRSATTTTPTTFSTPRRSSEPSPRAARPPRPTPSADALLPDLVAVLRPGDVALVMSNGSFDGLVGRLVAAPRSRDAPMPAPVLARPARRRPAPARGIVSLVPSLTEALWRARARR